MAMNIDDRDQRLDCGARLGPLIDQVADRTAAADPQHQRTCPHCREALAELERVWGHVRAVAREDVAPPQRIVADVMRRIRRELSLPRISLPLDELVPRLVTRALLQTERGSTRISDTVVARIATEAALDVAGVEFLGGSVDISVSGRRVAIGMRLVVEYGASLPALAATVRANAIAHVEALTGLEVERLDISIGDVSDPGVP